MANNIEEDEVVDEIDVFVNNDLKNQLYMLIYPTRKLDQRFPSNKLVDARIKPNNKKLELTTRIDTDNSNYDGYIGEQIARSVDGDDKSYYDCNSMDKMVYEAKAVKSEEASELHYIGVRRSDGIHLTRITDKMMMQQSFNYIDMAERRRAEQEKLAKVDEFKPSEARLVTARGVQFETAEAKAARELTREAYEKRLADEAWRPLMILGDSCPSAMSTCKQMVYDFEPGDLGEMKHLASEMSVEAQSYIDSLIPDIETKGSDGKKHFDNENIDEFLKSIFKRVKIIKFILLEQLAIENHFGDLHLHLAKINKYAVILRGLLVVRSQVLYPPDSKSAISGVNAEDMCLMRDYILSRFAAHPSLERQELYRNLDRYPPEEVHAVLQEIAVCRARDKGSKICPRWELLYPDDLDFQERNREQCNRQATIWANKLEQFSNKLHIATRNQYAEKLPESIGLYQSSPPPSRVKNEPVDLDLPAVTVKQEPDITERIKAEK